jgi:CheY-like chemotaxis protein
MVKQILIADDEQMIRAISTRVLERTGYQAHAEEDGAKALNYLKQHPEVDAIITDYDMPNGNGLELTKQAREYGFKGPIVLFCSQSSETVQEVLDAGADIHLGKPLFPITKLSETLDKLLGN